MFIIFKHLIIYLNILLCTCAPLSNNNEVSTIIDFEHKVQMEIARFEDLLSKLNLVTPLKENDILIKGIILGKLEEIVKEKLKVGRRGDLLLINQGRLEEQKEWIIRSVLKTFVVPYVCRNLELYEKVWDNGGKNSENFDPEDTENTDVKGHDLDTQTMSNYKYHAKVWDRILTSSVHPLVKDFKGKIQALYPELTLPIVAKNLGLTHALLLNNAKHGVINDEPEIVKLINPNDLVAALKARGALKDPVVLGIIKTFEEVISGL